MIGNFKKNKKGDVNLLDFFRLTLMIAVAYFVYLIFATSSNLGFEQKLYAEQLTLDQTIFDSVSGPSYLDSNGRIHIGIIDAEKLDTQKLTEAFALQKRRGVRINVSSPTGFSKEVYINEVEFKLLSGFSDTYKKSISEPVTIKNGESFFAGKMEVTYVFKKE